MSALTVRTDFTGWGDVPEKYQAPANTMTSIVSWYYSYATPIAWRYPNGDWYMPPVRYSQTTSGHQKKVAQTLKYDFEVETSLMIGYGGASRYCPRMGW
jgi:hypothetical protein